MSNNRERPILFGAPMVRAIRDHRKTQTRRVVKPQPTGEWAAPGRTACPYGQTGDRLWVREAVWLPRPVTYRDLREGADTWPKCIYSADSDDIEIEWLREQGWKQHPSIHMPRWASRITLDITCVRVERVQSISDADIVAEGVTVPVTESGSALIDVSTKDGPAAFLNSTTIKDPCAIMRAHWAALWCSVNGRASWDADPWVWVLDFKQVHKEKNE